MYPTFTGGILSCSDTQDGKCMSMSWSCSEATVACRQLGYPGAATYSVNNKYGAADTLVWKNVHCNGDEEKLIDCEHDESYPNYPEYLSRRIAGVSCILEEPEENFSDVYPCDMVTQQPPDVWAAEGTIMDYTTDRSNKPEDNEIGSIALVGGSGPHEGNVFLNMYPTFTGGILSCSDTQDGKCMSMSWSCSEATVACRQLGYPGAATYSVNNKYGAADTLVWKNVHCNGDEEKLIDCEHDESYPNYPEYLSRRIAGVSCILEEPEENFSDLYTCNMVTQQPPDVWAAEGTVWGYTTDRSNKPEDDEIGSISLVGGSGPHEGNVFVNMNPHFTGGILSCSGTEDGNCKSGRSWSCSEANVVCRQLGYPGAATYSVNNKYGAANTLLWKDVICNGDEDKLIDCQHDDGYFPGEYLSQRIAGVSCILESSETATDSCWNDPIECFFSYFFWIF